MKIDVHHYINFPPDGGASREVVDLLRLVLKQGGKIMAYLEALETAVAENRTAIGSAIVLLDSISAKLVELKNDPAAIQKFADDLNTSKQELAASITRNTPAE